jgi:undecaprenyl-diphosphatase
MDYAHFISTFSGWVENIVIVGGYPFLFFTILFETLPIIGTFIPGHITIIMSGFLVKIGIFNIWVTIIIAIAGAVLGDYLGYWLGRRYGMSLIDRFKGYIFLNDKHIEKVKGLVDKHTGKALLLGRLSPVTRALMPFIIGATHAEEKKFWLFNFLGGSIWAIGSITIGYIFGAGYEAASGTVGRFILFATVLALIILWGYRFVNIRFHVFQKYELFVLAVNLLSLWGLATIIDGIWRNNEILMNLDMLINQRVVEYGNEWIIYISNIVSDVGGVISMIIISVLSIVIFIYRGRWRSMAIILLTVSSSSVFFTLMKDFFMRGRPANAIIDLYDPSFPSGHATMAAAFFFAIIYLSMPKIRSWIRRELLLVLCVIIVLAIGASRILLNVHWFSDVVAGWALGLFSATSSILLVRYLGGIFHKKIISN